MQGTRTEDLQKAVRYYLKKSGIPVESSKGEFGRGQHELNVAYSDILTMADNHVLYKQCFKAHALSRPCVRWHVCVSDVCRVSCVETTGSGGGAGQERDVHGEAPPR